MKTRMALFVIVCCFALAGCEADPESASNQEDASSSATDSGDVEVSWSGSSDTEEEGQWQGGANAVPEFSDWSGE